MMVSENIYSIDGPFLAFRCISCGEIVDHIILENRKNHEAKTRREQRLQKKDIEGTPEQLYPHGTPEEPLRGSSEKNP